MFYYVFVANLIQISLTILEIMGCLDIYGIAALPTCHKISTEIMDNSRRLLGDPYSIANFRGDPLRNHGDFNLLLRRCGLNIPIHAPKCFWGF